MTTCLQSWMPSRQNLFLGIVLVVVFAMIGNQAIAAEISDSSPEGVALQAASWLITIPYGAVKVAYALGGGIVGGLAWVVTGGSMATAKGIWIPSMTGDYIVQPQHLTGEKPLHFVGVSSDEAAP